jgi:hypothetical protein
LHFTRYNLTWEEASVIAPLLPRLSQTGDALRGFPALRQFGRHQPVVGVGLLVLAFREAGLVGQPLQLLPMGRPVAPAPGWPQSALAGTGPAPGANRASKKALTTKSPMGSAGRYARNARRRFGPERAEHFGLRAGVEVTDAPNAPALGTPRQRSFLLLQKLPVAMDHPASIASPDV